MPAATAGYLRNGQRQLRKSIERLVAAVARVNVDREEPGGNARHTDVGVGEATPERRDGIMVVRCVQVAPSPGYSRELPCQGKDVPANGGVRKSRLDDGGAH